MPQENIKQKSILPSVPNVMYKYRDWNEPLHKKILTKNEIFFASPYSFNDPFDLNIPFRYDKLSESELRANFEKHFDLTAEPFSKLNIKAKEELKEHFIKKIVSGDKKVILNLGEHLYKKYSNFGVFSVSTKKDNILMWSHYANSHQGFCVGFNLLNITRHTQSDQKNSFIHLEVAYQKKYPELIPNLENLNINNMFSQFMTKSILWKYEKEWRILTPNKANFPFQVNNDSFNEIILGMRISKANKEEILEVVKRKFPNVKIYQAFKSHDKFKLNLERVLL